MKKIINDPARFVDETIDGILLAHPASLRAATADRRALVRGDAPRAGKVGIVTGGGSGHLPVFLGYVGFGLLDGVAVGNVFSSPSSAQIAAATRAVDGGAGVLYLYGNYGGDIYNFDIAADLVAADGIPTETVLAADDVASAPATARAGRRGVAGMVYAFKIAGAAAERGDDLATVAAIARKVGENTRTMGVGLSPTILPAAGEPTFTLAEGEMELGIGIHGEPGTGRGPLAPADVIADRLLDTILEDLPPLDRARVSVLVNGLGATPLEELYLLYRRVATRLGDLGVSIHSPFIGNYVTSLEMAGASISLLVLDDELTELLDAPAGSPFFQHGGGHVPTPGVASAAIPVVENTETSSDDPAGAPTALAKLLIDLFDALPAHENELRDLDAALGDGDLGITVAVGSQAARAEVVRNPSVPDAVLLQRVGAAFAAANPSTFAALVGGGLIHASGRLQGSLDRAAVVSWARDVQARIAQRGGAALGDKTILDVIEPSLAVLEAAAGQTAIVAIDRMTAAVDTAISETTPLQSARGRAAWLRERSAGLADPGMAAYRALLVELGAVLRAGV